MDHRDTETQTHTPKPMNIRSILLTALLVLALPAVAHEKKGDKHDHKHDKKHKHDDDHDHEHEEKIVGPNGGRVVTSTEPHFEFLVLDDRKLKITFLSEEGEAVAPGEAKVTAVGGERSKPTKFAFAEADGALLSDNALPEGEQIPMVLQVRLTPDAKTVTEKFTVNLAKCPTCEYKEYACICEHDHDHDHDHDHKKDKKKKG